MADLVVIVPTRERPEAAATLAQAFHATCTAGTRLIFAVDESDSRPPAFGDHHEWLGVQICRSTTMVEALNEAARIYAPDAFAIGFMGDDHFPRTFGWDNAYLEALKGLGTGIVYGNDLLQGHRLPTQCAMTSDVVRALGYMSPPELRHMYVDNFWRDLGNAADCLRYLHEVIVEHRHPIAGKAQIDEGYLRVNAPAVYEADERAYAEYCRTRFAEDVAKVQALRG